MWPRGHPRNLSQWFFKITDYAERLLADLTSWSTGPSGSRHAAQLIGRSEGALFTMQVDGLDASRCLHHRPDTIFGMTFAVLAPEHPLVDRLVAGTEYEAEVRAYQEKAAKESEIDRMAEGDKTGVFTGRYAVNPVNDRRVPIYIADYVLMGYGTGAIMAVPGQDQRDWDFAEKYGIDIIRTVEPPADFDGKAYVGEGRVINSGFLDGLDIETAKERMIAWLEEKGIGRRQVQYRLRDWLISRQRYWGCPIPIVHCPDCGQVPVPEDQLPVELPDVEDYAPKDAHLWRRWTRSSTRRARTAVARPAETDTMDTFVDSSWYFLRFTDAATRIRSSTRRRRPTGCRSTSIGGIEHAVLHLLYSRFITKVLFDMGLSPVEGPFARLFTQG